MNGRVRSKGLVRLCPSASCSRGAGTGCSSDYGDYVVDMHSFLEAYIAWQVERNAYKCAAYGQPCFNECFESTSASCYRSCYKKNGVNAALCSNNNNNNANAYSNYASNGDGNDQFDLQTS